METHKSTDVTKRLLEVAEDDRNTLTPMQLMKLVYLCHGWMLGVYRRPLIQERVEAWRYGPVIPELYHIVKEFRSNPVPIDALGEVSQAGLDKYGSTLIENVYNIYREFDGIQLSALTHAKGTPWDITWNNGRGTNQPISNDLIENHFKKLYGDR